MNTERSKTLSGNAQPAGLLPRAGLLLQVFLIAAMAFAAYWPAMRGAFLWDDDLYAANPVLDQPGALAKIWTLGDFTDKFYYKQYPAVYTALWAGRRAWGGNTAGFHLLNLLLHITNACLAWCILRRLRARWAWLAGAIFALHPVQLESVAWITELKNVLSGLFFLLALLAYLRFEEGSRRKFYLLSLALFALALLSKPVTVVLPPALLLLRWARGLKTGRKELADLAPFFLLALAAGLFTARLELDTANLEISLAPAQRLLLAARALWFYPLKFLLPVNLSFSYPRWALDPAGFRAWLWPAWTGLAGALLWRFRARLGRLFFAALGFYVLNIALFLGFISIYTFRYSFVADHYQYLASLGLAALAAGGLAAVCRPRGLALGAGAAVLCLLGGATWRHSAVYRTPAALWEDVLKKDPGSRLALINLGAGLTGEPAVAYWERATAAHPEYYEAQSNLAAALMNLGRKKEAEARFGKALELNPKFTKAHENLARLYASQGDHARAAAHYGALLALDPGYGRARNDYGLLLLAAGKPPEAEVQFRKAAEYNPSEAGPLSNLGMALYAQGKMKEAAQALRGALKLNPAMAQTYNNLGMALYALGRTREGDRAFQDAVKLEPRNALFYFNWGSVEALAGRPEAAEKHLLRSRELKAGPPGR